MVLSGLVDSNYKFIFTDVGCEGRINGGGIFSNKKTLNCSETEVFFHKGKFCMIF